MVNYTVAFLLTLLLFVQTLYAEINYNKIQGNKQNINQNYTIPQGAEIKNVEITIKYPNRNESKNQQPQKISKEQWYHKIQKEIDEEFGIVSTYGAYHPSYKKDIKKSVLQAIANKVQNQLSYKDTKRARAANAQELRFSKEGVCEQWARLHAIKLLDIGANPKDIKMVLIRYSDRPEGHIVTMYKNTILEYGKLFDTLDEYLAQMQGEASIQKIYEWEEYLHTWKHSSYQKKKDL